MTKEEYEDTVRLTNEIIEEYKTNEKNTKFVKKFKTRQVVYVSIIVILVIWVISLYSDLSGSDRLSRSLLKESYNNELNAIEYESKAKEYKNKYNELHDATDCFYDEETDWKDCVFFLSTYR